ncbi:hypothetical protein SDC9_144209 [bioreactor metagenome]|uniref:Uncharacterized protein n=1 Tax=bioreactor metagenome TaxID=1076179 RepID=A0A645E6V3_9ZZZZ
MCNATTVVGLVTHLKRVESLIMAAASVAQFGPPDLDQRVALLRQIVTQAELGMEDVTYALDAAERDTNLPQ